MSYIPSEMPAIDDVETLRRFLQDELRRISDGMDSSAGYQLVPLYAEPKRLRGGLVVYADGTDWNPGYGEGLYVYFNGAWQPFSTRYEEGDWTPVITFATPGDLAITYSQQLGKYTRIGNLVHLQWKIITSAFTHTTASGDLLITSLPFAMRAWAGGGWRGGGADMTGYTKAGYTWVTPVTGLSLAGIQFRASGSGVTRATLVAGDVPSGGALAIDGSMTYMTDAA